MSNVYARTIRDSRWNDNIVFARVGIFGKVTQLYEVLKSGDRVKIYRGITADPTTAPRQQMAGDGDDD